MKFLTDLFSAFDRLFARELSYPMPGRSSRSAAAPTLPIYLVPIGKLANGTALEKPSNGQREKIAPTVEVQAVERVLKAHAFNPEFRASATAQEMFLQDSLGEDAVPPRMVAKESTPVVFVVPEGTDSMDLLYGPIEVNPGHGSDADLDEIMTVGDMKLAANVRDFSRPLTPGEQLIVTVPWRAASWVEMPASRLRLTVYARFYKSQK